MSQDGTLEQLLAALHSVDTFKAKVFNAKSPAEMQAAQAGLNRITHEIAQKFPGIQQDLINEFHTAHRESGGSGAIEKKLTDKSYNSRVKAQEGFKKASTSIRTWGDDYVRDRQIISARKAYTTKLAKLQKFGGSKEDIQATKTAMDRLPKAKGVSDTPSVIYIRKNHDGSMSRVEMPADAYVRMATHAAYQTQRNLGIAAAASGKSGYVIVEDGPSCGKRGHNNGEAVNGQVWDIDMALRYPLSHPNCQRVFRPSDGPPDGKKTKAQLKAMGLAPSRTHQHSNLESIAKAAAGAGMVASIGGTIIQNPFIRTMIRDIIADAEIRLNPIAEQLLTRLTSYGRNEAAAFEAHATEVGATTQEQFNVLVRNSFDDSLANDEFLAKGSSESVRISAPQARVLGLPRRVTKEELLTRLDDYGDWLVHEQASTQTIEERLQTAVNFSHANEELHRTAALQFHLDQTQGIDAKRNWYKIVRSMKESYQANPDKADRELVKLLASVIDPAPWLKVGLTENTRFTLGMTSKGRQEIAAKLYDVMKGQRRLSDTELKWAEQLGMDLTKFNQEVGIGKRDIINAFTPRVTYHPGGLFSATLGLVNGKVQPIIRMYPNGTFARYVSLESRLRAGSIEELIKELRKSDLPLAERWIAALSHVAQEDLITSVNLFRNSPLRLSLRMVGSDLDSYAIRVLPDNDYLRYSYRFTLDSAHRDAIQNEVRRRLLNGENIEEVINDLAKTNVPVDRKTELGLRKEARAIVRKEAAQIARVDMNNWVEGFTVLPNYGGGFKLNGLSISQREAIGKLRILGNNLIMISKKTHYGYDQLLEYWKESKATIKEVIAQVGEKKVFQIHTFQDATNVLADAFRKKTSLVDAIAGEDLTNADLFFADKRALENPALRKDLARFRLLWEREYPGLAFPRVQVVDVLDSPMEAGPGVIRIRDDIAKDWELMGNLRRKAVRIGHFPPDTQDSLGSLMHEAAHSVILGMNDFDKRKLMIAAIKSQGWPAGSAKAVSQYTDLAFVRKWFSNPKIAQRISRTVSGYSTKNIEEFLAEAMTEYFGSGNPRPIALAVGDQLKAMLIQ